MEKYKNKYRISSARLLNWDYGSNASYFITICTKNREHYFGGIENGQMILNELGKQVVLEWLKTSTVRPDMNLELGEFVVMPNHFHAIIIIGENEYNTLGRDAIQDIDESASKFGPQYKNLSSIVRGFKGCITAHARKTETQFGWQERFHDHIIRNTQSFEKIQHYIATNPQNWKEDKFYEPSPSPREKQTLII